MGKRLRVLVVEDEALLAMDIGAMIEDAGHEVVGEGASLDEVAAMSSDLSPDMAFVDIQLAEGSSGLDVCRLIRNRWRSTFIVFVTANAKMVPDDYAGAHGLIPKPFSRCGMTSALQYIVQGLSDPPPRLAKPSSFSASPKLARSWACP